MMGYFWFSKIMCVSVSISKKEYLSLKKYKKFRILIRSESLTYIALSHLVVTGTKRSVRVTLITVEMIWWCACTMSLTSYGMGG